MQATGTFTATIAFKLGSCGERRVFAARGAERRQLGMFKLQLARFLKELIVFGIGARPAAFDILDPQPVEHNGNAQLVMRREGNPLRLRAVTQRGIEQFDHFLSNPNALWSAFTA